MNKIDKFYPVKNLFQCPICGKKMRFHAGGLVCKKEHRFDISSRGYVNFLQRDRALKGYDAEFFQSRSRFFAAGFYDHIADKVTEIAAAEAGEGIIVDAGCGEGFYSLRLSRQCGARILSFDIAKDAVKIAASHEEPVRWMVADITDIPLRDGVADCILDIFTPASYGQFRRVLKKDGILLKVVPGKNHMIQLRQAAGDAIRNQEYSNEEVLEYFCRHFFLTDRITLSETREVSEEILPDLLHMTPVLFDVERNRIDFSGIREITVEGELLIGRAEGIS